MAGEIDPAQSQIADQIENLVSRGFVGEPQGSSHRSIGSEHQKFAVGQVQPDALLLEFPNFALQNERPAMNSTRSFRFEITT